RNPRHKMLRHLRLALNAPDPRPATTLRRPFQRLARREQFMPVVHRTHLWISRIRPPLPRRVRHHHLRLLPYLLIRLAQRNRIPITLRHLPTIEPWYSRRLRQHHVWFNQFLAELKEFGKTSVLGVF